MLDIAVQYLVVLFRVSFYFFLLRLLLVVVFVKVVTSTEKIKKINILNLSQDEIDKMKYEASKYNQEIGIIIKSKFEIAAIVLKKNPIINIYDILNID